jgi:hypothetical protein
VTYEFVIFCDDFGGIDSVPRIWNTNGEIDFRQEHEEKAQPSAVSAALR